MSKKLIEYQEQEKHKPNDQKTVPSGVKSPNSEREMLVVLPLVEHPQIKGLFKAIDPGTKSEKPWIGWVEYTPETSQKPEPTKAEKEKKSKQMTYEIKLASLIEKKQLVDLGVITEIEAGLDILRGEIKQLASDLGKV